MTTIVDGNSGGTALTTSTAVNQATTGMTVQRLTSGSGTYTTPANVKYIRVKMIGGGGGAYGTDAINVIAGSAGGTTTFGSWTVGGGASAITGGTGGSTGTGTLIQRMRGNNGGSFLGGSIQGSQTGGAGPWGGAGNGGYVSAGAAAAANSGAGGGGGATAGFGCYGAGAGEYVEFIVNNPSATYSYAVAAGGAGASTTYSGGNGGSGVIIVEEYYNYA